MTLWTRAKIKAHEKGFVWKDGVLVELLGEGTHWRFGRDVEVVSMREVCYSAASLRDAVGKGLVEPFGRVVDLADHERALVWVDGRFHQLLFPGLHLVWTTERAVEVEIVSTETVRFVHDRRPAVFAKGSGWALEGFYVPEGAVGLVYLDGAYSEELPAGLHVFWRGVKRVEVRTIELRAKDLTISGQEVMTSDKVTIRMTGVVLYQVVDAQVASRAADDIEGRLYTKAQLALREVVGVRTLDQLLEDKEQTSVALQETLVASLDEVGIEVESFGVKDVILPGDMKTIFNQVIEARKASEAAVITRQEETAAMRSQANTAKLLEKNPTLLRLKELETLERVAAGATLRLVVGEGRLTEQLGRLL